jgi:putative ABC transport system substrate-binding protein
LEFLGRASVRRRAFIAGLGAAAWPALARAQQGEPRHRIGALMSTAADDPVSPTFIAALVQGLQQAGWTVGRNLLVEYRWAAGNAGLYSKYAAELVALSPEVILAANTSSVRALFQVTRNVPIVFAAATDPVGGGLVASLAHPGGNVTGFAQRDFGLSAKSLELLREIAPRFSRAAVLRDSTATGGAGQLGAIQAAAPSFGIELTPIDLRDAGEIEREVTAFARQSNGALFVTSSARATAHRELIISLAARYKLPAVYPFRYWADGGGLLSYGPDQTDNFRRAADYIARILKGEKPGDLPVEQPTKFELVINLKTAKALGLEMPPSLLARADEVIE